VSIIPFLFLLLPRSIAIKEKDRRTYM